MLGVDVRALPEILERLEAQARPGARDLPFLDEELDHVLDDLRGDGEAQVLGAPERAGIDPDDLALDVDERPARVARVDRRVGLDPEIVGREVEIPLERRDDAARDRALEAVGRSHRHDELAHAELREVSKRFGGVKALSEVDLAIAPGTIHALVGENGAGKSTLGKILAGVHRPDGGELAVLGRTVAYRSARDALIDGITIIAQEPTLVPHRSVLENVFLGVESNVAGVVDRRRLKRLYRSLVESTGIELPAHRLARTLRVADQQKVEILRAIARDARFIVMDEPTSALTSDEVEKLFGLIRRFRDGGTTIVYVFHAYAP